MCMHFLRREHERRAFTDESVLELYRYAQVFV